MPPTQHTVHANGLDLCVFEWAGADPPLIFAHATGFHARCWDQVIAHLPDRHAYAVDMRGHGRSAKPAPPDGYAWGLVGDDLAALTGALNARGAVGIGHSWSGYGMALAAARDPGAFSRLILFDPVILPEPIYHMDIPPYEHFSAKRRSVWATPDEMFERFKDRPPFSTWNPQVLRDYVNDGLLPNPDGDGYVLACLPAIESSIYPQATRTDPYPELSSVQCPVLVVRFGDRHSFAPTDFQASPTNPELAGFFPHGQDVHLKGTTHFAPMEDPSRIAKLIQEHLHRG